MIKIDMRTILPTNPNRPQIKRTKRITKIVWHCSARESSVEKIAREHITPGPKNPVTSKGCPNIAYHWVINRDGSVVQCLDDSLVGWHAGNVNPESVAICLNYGVDDAYELNPKGKPWPAQEFRPTDAQFASLYELTAELLKQYGLQADAVMGHREVEGSGWIWKITPGHRDKALMKTCPGRTVDLDKGRALVQRLLDKK